MNLVDARTFNDRQVIRVAPASNDEHISGIAMSPDSKVCFVGMYTSIQTQQLHSDFEAVMTKTNTLTLFS